MIFILENRMITMYVTLHQSKFRYNLPDIRCKQMQGLDKDYFLPESLDPEMVMSFPFEEGMEERYELNCIICDAKHDEWKIQIFILTFCHIQELYYEFSGQCS